MHQVPLLLTANGTLYIFAVVLQDRNTCASAEKFTFRSAACMNLNSHGKMLYHDDGDDEEDD